MSQQKPDTRQGQAKPRPATANQPPPKKDGQIQPTVNPATQSNWRTR